MTDILSPENPLDVILKDAESKKISDIHFKTGIPLSYRNIGDIEFMNTEKIYASKDILEFINPILSDKLKLEFKQNMQLDFAFNSSIGVRYRANLYRVFGGVGLALRTINSVIRTLDEMNCPEIFKKIAELEKGLVIVSGPTGSGFATSSRA